MEMTNPKSAIDNSPTVEEESRISDVAEAYFSDSSNKTTRRTTTKLENIGEDGEYLNSVWSLFSVIWKSLYF